MLHRLHDHDAYDMLARGIPRDAAITVADIGANAGDISQRIRVAFPNATVYAFEPLAGPFDKLQSRAADDPMIRPVRVALGDRTGTIAFHEAANPVYSSVLPPAARTLDNSFGAARTVSTSEVPVRRLDEWSEAEGVDRFDLLKLDVQGYELAVLSGAERVVERATAVYSEAHLAPAYDGAATFAEIDLHLRDRGFVLHQIHEVMIQGADQQALQLDALWLRPELLQRIRTRPLEAPPPPWAAALLRTFRRCAASGLRRVALYGAGTHTRTIEPWLDAGEGVDIVAVVDDNPARTGETFVGRPVLAPTDIEAHGINAVILSSDSYEDGLWARTAGLRERGVPVMRLYGHEW